jgi:hypothetical protein
MSTLLSTMINDQNQYQTLQQIPEENKVRFIDQVLKTESIDYKFPFRRKKVSLRVFDGVYEYPMESDYDGLSFLDNDEEVYQDRARFIYRSFNEFLEDKDYRNDFAEIHENGSVYLGCRYQLKNAGSRLLNNAEVVGNWSVSGDATTVEYDNVFRKEGNGSMKVSVVASTDQVIIETALTSFSDTNYNRKYHFVLIYLPSVPTSVVLGLGNDDTAYFYQTMTTQFAGQAFQANAWNLIAYDLNEANEIGTVSTSAFDYQRIVINGVSTGYYYIDSSYVREWELLDLWYHSKNLVMLEDGSYQELFYNYTTEEYFATSYLIGPREWANFINLHAMILGAIDKNDNFLKQDLMTLMYGGVLRGKNVVGMEEKLKNRYKSISPIITNSNWNFRNNPINTNIRTFIT